MQFKATYGSKTDPYLKLFIYGEYGVGKTWLAGSAADVADMCPILFINAEAGTKSIFNGKIANAEENITFIPVETYDQFNSIYKYLRAISSTNDAERIAQANERMFGDSLRDITTKFKTVIIDSLSEIDNKSFNSILGVSANNIIPGSEKATFNTFGTNTAAMTKVLTSFRSLKMHVIMTAPSEYREVKMLGTDKMHVTRPLLIGSSRDKALAYFDIVGYYEQYTTSSPNKDKGAPPSNKIYRRLWLQAHGSKFAKSRLTPDDMFYLTDPTLSEIYKFTN